VKKFAIGSRSAIHDEASSNKVRYMKLSAAFVCAVIVSSSFLIKPSEAFSRLRARVAGLYLTFQPKASIATLSHVVAVSQADLDWAAVSVWVDGKSQALTLNPNSPFIVWGPGTAIDYRGLSFGDSKKPGPRHLRLAFKKAISIGSILTRAGGKVSVLKPTAPYPGDPADDSQWISAERLENTGSQRMTTGAEATVTEYAIWVLSSAAPVRAVRFTHDAQAGDPQYAGWLGGAAFFAERYVNLAPQSLTFASANDKGAVGLETEQKNIAPWANVTLDTAKAGPNLAEHPPWIMLAWPRPVTLEGLGLLDVGFQGLEIQTYAGPAQRHPAEAADSDWKTIQSDAALKSFYPAQLDLHFVSFKGELTSRAIRLRLTKALPDSGLHEQLRGRTMNGTRVWLGGILAFSSLKAAPLASGLLSPPAEQTKGLIPVRFSLPTDGEATLVIEDSSGKRVRNLISQTPYPKGENTVWWDGTDDLGRDRDASDHGVYQMPGHLVQPGAYTVRGLWHRPLELRYQMTVYSPGTPPWPTADGSGGWMTNHTPASAVAFVPAARSPNKQPLMYIGAWLGEGSGSELSWTDLTGAKVGGRGWIGGNGSGAQYLAYDNGPAGDADTFLYVASAVRASQSKASPAEIRLTKLTSHGDQAILKSTFSFTFLQDNVQLPSAIGGLAVRNNLLVFSQTALDRLIFVDAKQGMLVGTVPFRSPRGLAFDSSGRLLMLTANSLVSVNVSINPAALSNSETLISGLQDPQGITVDSTGKIFISDQGNSNQVKAYSKDGHLLATFGQAGPLQAGPYNRLHMNHPKGVALDSNGRLWVAEDDFQPKRVSIWNPDGTLERAFYGPARYGGGGVLDPTDASRFFYYGMEFHVDLQTREQNLVRVYYRPSADSILGSRPDLETIPDRPVDFSGHRYLTNAFETETAGARMAFLFLDKGGITQPAAGIGMAQAWDLLKQPAYRALWPAGISPSDNAYLHPAFFSWSDLNGNGKADPEEIHIRSGFIGGVTLGDDGSFLLSNSTAGGSAPGHAVRVRPTQITPLGVPVYDLAQAEVLAPSQSSASDGGDQILFGSNGWLVQTTAPPPYSNYGVGGSRNGAPQWSYPSLWPGLHPSHNSPAPDRPGMLIGTTHLLGGLVDHPQAGPLFFLNGNQGDIYLFTQDGLFVSQLFKDVRQGQLWQMPSEQANALLNNLTLHDENFFPSVTKTTDGKVYIGTGTIPAIVRVDGLETIKRLPPFQIQLSVDSLRTCQEAASQRQSELQASGGSKLLRVGIAANAPILDGNPERLPISDWAPIDTRGVAAWFDSHNKPYDVKGALMVAGSSLIVAWETGDPKLLDNSGGDVDTLFHTGGGLDLMLQTDPSATPDRSDPVDGDIRLFVTRVRGQTQAILYRPVAPKKAGREKTLFSSPWRTLAFDAVQDVSSQVKLFSDSLGDYEVSIPVELIGLAPQPSLRLKGDIGILRGSAGQTTQRVYWSNKATAIVSDIPSEALLTPKIWGIFEFNQLH
jgi:DNA-binding beta-propeller fold protein YncE